MAGCVPGTAEGAHGEAGRWHRPSLRRRCGAIRGGNAAREGGSKLIKVWCAGVPSGKLAVCYRKSPCLMDSMGFS